MPRRLSPPLAAALLAAVAAHAVAAVLPLVHAPFPGVMSAGAD